MTREEHIGRCLFICADKIIRVQPCDQHESVALLRWASTPPRISLSAGKAICMRSITADFAAPAADQRQLHISGSLREKTEDGRCPARLRRSVPVPRDALVPIGLRARASPWSATAPRAPLVPSRPVGAVARGVLALDVSLLPPGVISVPTSRSERHRCCPYTSTASTRLVSVVLLLRAAERQRSRRGAPRVPRSLRSPRQQRTVVGAGAPAAVVVGRPGGGEPALGVVPLGRPWRSRTANPSRCLRRSSGSSLPATISSSPRAPLHTIPRTKEL
jgi:hypothetical protein